MIWNPNYTINKSWLLGLMGGEHPPISDKEQAAAYWRVLEARMKTDLEQRGYDFGEGNPHREGWNFSRWICAVTMLAGNFPHPFELAQSYDSAEYREQQR